MLSFSILIAWLCFKSFRFRMLQGLGFLTWRFLRIFGCFRELQVVYGRVSQSMGRDSVQWLLKVGGKVEKIGARNFLPKNIVSQLVCWINIQSLKVVRIFQELIEFPEMYLSQAKNLVHKEILSNKQIFFSFLFMYQLSL